MTDEWSASRIKSWFRCPTKYRNEYILNIGGGTSDIADFGTVFHHHCENRLLRAMGQAAVTSQWLHDPYEQARLDALWAGYEARWDDSSWRVLGAEVMFNYELSGHVISSHKGMDGLVQDADGKVWVVEHKTTGSDVSAGSAYYERLALDAQCSIYLDAATALGYDVAGVIYDVISRPRHERKLATPKEEQTWTKPKGCKVCGGKVGGGKVEAVKGTGQRANVPPMSWLADAFGDWSAEAPGVRLTAERMGAEWMWTAEVPGWRKDGKSSDDRAAIHDAFAALCACQACDGTGWSEPSRLHANQRAEDETPDEFHDRILADIAARPDDFYTRTVVTRTEAQKQRARASILDTIKLARIAEAADLFPMNDSACFAFNTRCAYWSACTGVDDINDRIRFPLRSKP